MRKWVEGVPNTTGLYVVCVNHYDGNKKLYIAYYYEQDDTLFEFESGLLIEKETVYCYFRLPSVSI